MLAAQKSKFFNLLLIVGMIVSTFGVFVAVSPQDVKATPRCFFGGVADQETNCPTGLNANTCYQIDGNQNVSTIPCPSTASGPGEGQGLIMNRLRGILNFLSIGVGIAITIMVIISGIQWIASGGNPQSRAAAVGRLTSAGIGLLLFVFGYALLNWLIPGGL